MEEFLKLTVSTIILRPYVFLFLIAYFYVAYLFLGFSRTLLFTFLAWAIAFLSEYSSIYNGFPYGHYIYTYETKVIPNQTWSIGQKEFFLFGVVPLIDSISYTFLNFIGYSLAIYLKSPLVKIKQFFIPDDTLSIHHSPAIPFLTAFLVTSMDIIIDPIATLGNLWFLR